MSEKLSNDTNMFPPLQKVLPGFESNKDVDSELSPERKSFIESKLLDPIRKYRREQERPPLASLVSIDAVVKRNGIMGIGVEEMHAIERYVDDTYTVSSLVNEGLRDDVDNLLERKIYDLSMKKSPFVTATDTPSTGVNKPHETMRTDDDDDDRDNRPWWARD